MKRNIWVAVITALVCWLFWSEPRGPDAELAKTAHQAVLFAREVESANQAHARWIDRYRLLATALGVGVPVVVAYLVFRSCLKNPPEHADVLEMLVRRGLVSLPDVSPPTLSQADCLSERPALAGAGDAVAKSEVKQDPESDS